MVGCNQTAYDALSWMSCGSQPGCLPQSTSCNCGCSPCQCQQTQRSGPSPYYDQAGCIQETHCQSVTNEVLAAAISTGSSFVIPSCNTTGSVNFPGLARIQLHSYLWNYDYGYFEVVGFDSMTGDVELKNHCNAGNAAPGTVINPCTLFTVSPPP